MKDFNDKVVVITGAGSGIGRELALQLGKRGAVLALNDWTEAGLDETWEQLPENARGLKDNFDVGDRAAVEKFAHQVHQDLGRVDVVINNAGLSIEQKPVIYTTVEDFEKVLRVNLWGVIYGSLAFLPYLRERRGSSLVNISSVFGLFAFPGSGPYNVSKFGVRGFTETLRVELRGTGIHIGCVHPGGIKTNIVKNVEMADAKAKERLMSTFDKQARTTAEEAAKVIIRGIERRNPRILIGSDARFVDKITRLLPASYERVLARWLKPERFLAERYQTGL